MVDGVLDCLLQLQFDLLQTTNIVPSDSGHFDDSFAQRRWVGGAESESHILHRDAERVEHLRIDGFLVQIDEVHFFTDLLHRSFGAEGSDIRADVTVCVSCNLQKSRVKLVLKMK